MCVYVCTIKQKINDAFVNSAFNQYSLILVCFFFSLIKFLAFFSGFAEI